MTGDAGIAWAAPGLDLTSDVIKKLDALAKPPCDDYRRAEHDEEEGAGKTRTGDLERAGYRVERIDFSVPVPGDSDLLDAVGRAVGRLRPSLFAYQFVAVAQTSS